MDFRRLVAATTAAAICLTWEGCLGIAFHAARHQCVHAPSYYSAPVVYSVVSELICSFKCCDLSCLFFDFTETTGCRIYGAGLEPASTNRSCVFKNNDYRPAGKEPFIEIAAGKPTFPVPVLTSTVHTGCAVDRNQSTRFEGGSVGAWWIVDLGAHYVVYSVVIWPRPGYFAYRFQAVEVRGGSEYRSDGNFTQWDLLGYYPGVYSDSEGLVYFNKSQGVCGRYIAVKRVNSFNDVFSFLEVYVYVAN